MAHELKSLNKICINSASVLLLYLCSGCSSIPNEMVTGAAGGTGTQAITQFVSSMFQQKIDLRLQKITLKAEKGANDDTGIMVHLIIFFDPGAMQSVMALSSKDYFRKKNSIKETLQGKIKVVEWTISPGKGTPTETITHGGSYSQACGAVIIGRYSAKGNHSIPVPGHAKEILVRLRRKNFTIDAIQ